MTIRHRTTSTILQLAAVAAAICYRVYHMIPAVVLLFARPCRVIF